MEEKSNTKKTSANGLIMPRERSIFKSRLFIESMFLNAVSAILLVVLTLSFSRMESVANELKELRNTALHSEEGEDVVVLSAEISKNSDKIDKLASYFVTDASFLKFLEEKDRLVKDGRVSDFSVSDKPVSDKAKNRGYAVLIELKGSPQEVSDALTKVDGLPFLMLPASMEVDIGVDKATTLKYIGVLYTNE